MAEKTDIQRLADRGLISQKSYGDFIKKFNPSFAAGASAPESKAGNPAGAPLDIRPPAARNKPKPKYASAVETKKGKKAKPARDTRPPAARNEPKPNYAAEVMRDASGRLLKSAMQDEYPKTGVSGMRSRLQGSEAEKISESVPRRKGD